MLQVHLLVVGKRQYGDSILLKFGDHTLQIEGGNPSSFSSSHPHDSIPKQLKELGESWTMEDAIDEGQDVQVSTMLAAMRKEPMIGTSDGDVAEFLMDFSI